MQSRKRARMVANRQVGIVSDYEVMKSSSLSKQAPQTDSMSSSRYLDLGDCDQVCQYCKAQFWTARNMCMNKSTPQFNIRLYNNGNRQCYDAPTSGTLGAIVYDSGPKSKNDFDIIIRFKDIAARLYTIEFQKRGLPHCHTLLWVTKPYKITSPGQVDNFISPEIPDPKDYPALYKIVTELMMHGPCGHAKTSAPCMANGVDRIRAKVTRCVDESEIEFQTYRLACERLGLLGDDKEWTYVFDEASISASARELRSLFAHMLLFCDVSNPIDFWARHWRKMSDDITQKAAQTSNVTGLYLNDEDLQNHLLYELEILLNSNSNSSSLSEFGLPMPTAHLLTNLQNRLLMEEKNYDRIKLAEEHKALQLYLNTEQQKVYDLIMKASSENKQELIFVYGHGGTGKTFLWTTITFALRAAGKIVLAVASSGIASLLLPSGRTAHSRFKIPLDITNETLCHVQKNTQLAQLLIETSLIIWDEAPMNDRKCFEAVDKTLRDILNEPTHPFGGKSVLLGGDFRQTLPIKPKGTKMDIIAASIIESSLWKHFNIHKLSQNMRLHRPNLTSEEKEKVSEFSSWLLKIGDGHTGISDENDPIDTKWVEIPNEYMIQEHNESLMQLVRFIYNDEALQNPTASMLCDRAIVCPKNNIADEINDLILDMLPGQKSVYLSVDSVIPHANEKGDTEILYPPEYLNLLNFNGFPKHRLELKVGAPFMLLRNINQLTGLCNGTRMIVTQLLPRIIEAKVITGTHIGHKVYIPRISLNHNDKELPFVFKRKQFPIKVYYAMTINKSQGQSLKKIGIYLPEPVFGHGQLYVALSRATSPTGLKILITNEEGQHLTSTKNIVYLDILKKIEIAKGNPIQAYANSNDKSHFQTPIKVGSCYRVTNFICEKSRTYMVIVPHKTSIRVGKAARFEEILDTDFPLHYFNFSPYDHLSNKTNKHEILTEVKSLFFDNAVNSMIHTQCNTMVEQHGYTNPEMLPAPLTAVPLKLAHPQKESPKMISMIASLKEAPTIRTSSEGSAEIEDLTKREPKKSVPN
ncbi:hypothetical protein L6452_37477 [Arctium lappa]|uniref:Uncharacterized protein n=1 Tax=Arctium lappa TaxID=4217 RepID=A0ACB8Y4M1_ARCLA|nr:hypothetical protein L6452_37477 [Arctium lappa]